MRPVLPFLLALLVCAPVHAQPLAIVEGVEDGDLRAAIEAVIGEHEDVEGDAVENPLRDARRAAGQAQRVLRSRGYYGATVEAFVDPDGAAGIRIDPGPQFLIGSVEVEAGDDADARRTAAGAVRLETGLPLLAADVLAAEARGVAALHVSGWPDAEAADRAVIVDHEVSEGRITFRYAPGPFSRYGDLVPETGQWSPDFIARIAPFRPGEIASRDEMLAYQRRLDSLDSVNAAQVSLGPVGEDDRRPVQVELTPGPRHSIETGLSYSTSEGAGAEILWQRRNLFGRDETLEIGATIAELNRTLLASITRPHWQRYRQTLYGEAGYTHEDTDAYDQDAIGAGVSVTRRSGEERTYGAGVFVDFARVRDLLGERDVHTVSLPLSAAYDSRDDPLDAHRGLLGSLEVTPAQTFGDVSDTYVRIELRSAAYLPVGDRLVAAGRVRLGSVYGASALALPADERFFAGGGGSARGFDYQSLSPMAADGTPIGGLSVVETSLELRYRLRERWGVVGFVDGAVATLENTPDFGELRYAAGLGVRYHFDFAPVRVDIATPLDRRDGEDPVQVYFSLGQSF